MEKTCKRILSAVLALILVVGVLPVNAWAAAKPKLSEKTLAMSVGDKKTLKVKNKPEGSTVTWSSNKNSVAKVSKKGVVTAKKAGKAVVTCKVKTTKKTYKLKCKITVTSGTALKITKVQVVDGKDLEITFDQAVEGKVSFKISSNVDAMTGMFCEAEGKKGYISLGTGWFEGTGSEQIIVRGDSWSGDAYKDLDWDGSGFIIFISDSGPYTITNAMKIIY